MKINIAYALKEKNRLAGEIAHLWQLFQNENSCAEYHKRKIDVKKTLQTIDHYTAKLVELKTKISIANQGTHLENMQRINAAKKRLEKLSGTDSSEDSEYSYNHIVKRTAIFNAQKINTMERAVRHEIAQLQDQIDAHNVKVQIEFESPLKRQAEINEWKGV